MGDHYVPAYYLKGFSSDAEAKQLWVYEKGSGNSFLTNVKNAASENSYYPSDLETYLANQIEQPANEVIKRILDRKSISAEERSALARYITVLWKRVPEHKDWIREKAPEAIDAVVKDLLSQLEQIEETNPSKHEIVSMRRKELLDVKNSKEKLIDEAFVDENWAKTIPVEWTEQIPTAINKMTWSYWVAPSPYFFITSDNPVFYFQWMGIGREKSEISFPISKQITLWGTWRSDLRQEQYIDADSQVIKEINRRTASSSSRYIYSPCNQEWIEKIARRRQFRLNRII